MFGWASVTCQGVYPVRMRSIAFVVVAIAYSAIAQTSTPFLRGDVVVTGRDGAGNIRVVRYDRTGTLRGQLIPPSNGHIGDPQFTTDHRLYVPIRRDIVEITAEGEAIARFPYTQGAVPWRISLARDASVYASSRFDSRILQYSSSGGLAATFTL